MTRLSVPDMTCGHCKSVVEAALGAVPQAGAVAVNLTTRQVEVAGPAPVQALVAALASAGYPASVVGV
jgi:copper chaperone